MQDDQQVTRTRLKTSLHGLGPQNLVGPREAAPSAKSRSRDGNPVWFRRTYLQLLVFGKSAFVELNIVSCRQV